MRILSPWILEWWLWKRALRRNETRLIVRPPRSSGTVEQAIRFLLDRGLDEHQVRAGSMPGASLDFVSSVVVDRLPADRPVRALHVGNFVGVSLCYFSLLVRERHPKSVVVSIDPNVPHRGIENPEFHVRSLLAHFGLLDSNLIIRGYTLARPMGVDDGGVGPGCENVLASLERSCGVSFDIVLVDGHHEESYVEREFAALRGLVAVDGIVVFDDVRDWKGVASVFRRALQKESIVELGRDERVGILQVRTALAVSH